MKRIHKFLLAFAVVAVGAGMVVEAGKTPEEKAAFEAAGQAYHQRLKVARLAVGTMRAEQPRPDSMRLTSVRVSADATVVCVDYWAENAFRVMLRDQVLYRAGKPDQSDAGWRKWCQGQMFEHAGDL